MTAVGKSCPIERERDPEHWTCKLTVSQAGIPTPAPAIRKRSCSLVNQSWGWHLAMSPARYSLSKKVARGTPSHQGTRQPSKPWRLGMAVRGGCLCGLIESEEVPLFSMSQGNR